MATWWPAGHHEHEFPHLWCAAPPGAQEVLVATSDRYFRPPYVGHRGWVGLRLDGDLDRDIDWAQVSALVEDAYREVAPARLVRAL